MADEVVWGPQPHALFVSTGSRAVPQWLQILPSLPGKELNLLCLHFIPSKGRWSLSRVRKVWSFSLLVRMLARFTGADRSHYLVDIREQQTVSASSFPRFFQYSSISRTKQPGMSCGQRVCITVGKVWVQAFYLLSRGLWANTHELCSGRKHYFSNRQQRSLPSAQEKANLCEGCL